MANTIVNVGKFADKVQANLRVGTPAIGISTTRYEAALSVGQTFNAPYMNSVRVQDYTYSTNATVDDTTLTADSLTINQVKIATANYDPLQNLLTSQWEDELAADMGYQMGRNINQFASQTGVNGADTTVAGGTLNAGNVYEFLTSISSGISRKRAGSGAMFGLVEPGFLDYLVLADLANGFKRADAGLRQGYVGDTNAGFRIYECHDLPCTVSLTMDTQPTNLDTTTVYGSVWTWVTDGTAATAGEINIGANIADAQAIFVTAINGTTPPAANDYIDLSTDERREYQNGQVAAATFATNVCVLTAYGRIGAAETFTAATNVFGDETCSQLFGHVGALDLVVQSAPQIEERLPVANKSVNVLGTMQYGSHVYNRMAKKLATGTFTV
ncbi:hypothetical protein HN682_08070 [Candidatus Peregrinibacteria bacterium]|jgi:hypothetical protein|nr:hypothetical protein [Candidatus Peregrinibacteria bacterium]